MSETPTIPPAMQQNPPQSPFEPVPEALVRSPGGLSLVWLIPLIAVAIGGWLAVKTFSERGPIITIEFKTASGLAAGQTKVKFKDVEVGQVTTIDVSADLKTVLATAELKPGFADFLTEHTRFWVERPRVTLGGVSGLDTLLSGAYIALDPGAEGQTRRNFRGLEAPPLFTTAEPGRRFMLRSPTLGSLNIGSPVHYRQIQVGQVVGYALDADGQAVSIELFIPAPHDALVSVNTRFWNSSGVDFSLSAAGINVDTQSLLSILIGGVSLDTPDTIDAAHPPDSRPAARDDELEVFPLYPSRDAAYAKIYARKERYLLFFGGSVRGLGIGAPVLLKGIDLGRVLDIQLQFDHTKTQFQIPVLIEIEPDRIAVQGDSTQQGSAQLMERLVSLGLRGQLKSGSLLTGQLYVDLDIYPDAKAETIARYGGYQVIPTLPAQLEALTTTLTNILNKLDAVPLAQIGRDLSETAAGANALVNAPELKRAIVELESALAAFDAAAKQLNDRVGPELVEMLKQTSQTAKSLDRMIATSSPTMIEMQRMFRDISTAARSMRLLTDYLERHPEALLQGKGRTGR